MQKYTAILESEFLLIIDVMLSSFKLRDAEELNRSDVRFLIANFTITQISQLCENKVKSDVTQFETNLFHLGVYTSY